MDSWLVAYRVVLLISLALSIFLLYRSIDHQDRPGARPLWLLVSGVLLYLALKLSISFVRGTPTVFGLTRLYPIASGLIVVGFLLLVIEYTGIEDPVSKRTVALLLSVPAVVALFAILELELLWMPVGHDESTLSGYAAETGGLSVFYQLFLNGVIILAIALLVWFGRQSADVFRTQVGALVFAAVVPLAGNLLYRLLDLSINPTPVLFVFSGFAIAWATLWADFLDLAPIGRDTVLAQLDAGVLTVDNEHRVIDINERGSRVLGLSDTEAPVGRHVDEVFAGQPVFRELYWSITEEDSDGGSVLELDGQYYEVELIRLSTAGRGTLGRSFVLRDITDKLLRERELERKNERLERFASVISHDIRNPLSVIQGRLDLVRQGVDVDSQLDNIEDNADRIEAIIEDALVMTRDVEEDSTEPVDVPTVAQHAWDHVDTGDVRLQVDCDLSVESVPSNLTQLFENLFRNAVEHGDDVDVVRVGVLSDDGGASGFYVADDGVGIPEEKRGEVTEDGYTTSDAGTGLGLSIISGIVDTHGWSLSVTESERGGARFDIELAD
jgi:signal transduction histidine kinase